MLKEAQGGERKKTLCGASDNEKTTKRTKTAKKKAHAAKSESLFYKNVFLKTINSLREQLPKIKLDKRITKALFILGFSALFAVGFANRDNLSPENAVNFVQDKIAKVGRGEGYPAKVKGTKVSAKNFKNFNGDVSFVSDTSFVSLNKSAKEVACRQHSFVNPIYQVAGSRAMIFDLYGKNYEIDRESKNIRRGKMENNILTGAIAQSGVFGFVTQCKGFLGELTVFAANGKDTYYKFYFADHYVSSMAFNKNGKSVAATGISAKEGALISTLYVFDYKSETPKFKICYEDAMLLQVEYLSNGNIVVIGDSLISFVNAKTGKKTDFSYESKTLTSFDINKGKGVVLALSLSEGGDDSELVIFDSSGKVNGNIKTNENVKSVSFEYGRIAILSSGKAILYNMMGNVLKTMEIENDAKEIKLFSSREAYILGLTQVKKIKF